MVTVILALSERCSRQSKTPHLGRPALALNPVIEIASSKLPQSRPRPFNLLVSRSNSFYKRSPRSQGTSFQAAKRGDQHITDVEPRKTQTILDTRLPKAIVKVVVTFNLVSKPMITRTTKVGANVE